MEVAKRKKIFVTGIMDTIIFEAERNKTGMLPVNIPAAQTYLIFFLCLFFLNLFFLL